MFFATLENYIPNDFIRTKAVVKDSKYTLALPIRLVEYISNIILSSVESVTIGN
jgi:hypothetical protein